MRTTTTLFAAAGVMAAAITSAAPALADEVRPSRGGRIQWEDDLDAARKKAAATGRPIAVYFTDDD